MDENRVLVEKDGKEVWLPQSKVKDWTEAEQTEEITEEQKAMARRLFKKITGRDYIEPPQK